MNKGFGEIEADLVVLQGFVHKPISLSLISFGHQTSHHGLSVSLDNQGPVFHLWDFSGMSPILPPPGQGVGRKRRGEGACDQGTSQGRWA